MLERKAASYIQLKKQYSKTLIVRYEDIVLDAEIALSELPIWDARRNERIVFPSGSARSFGRRNLETAEYVKKASASSYETLENEDRKCVLDQLSGGTLLELYPT